MAKYAESIGFEVFRGSEDNVLEIYKQVVDKYEGDVIIRVTGDCPLINPIIVDNVITKYLMYDYVNLDVSDTFQRGFDTEVFSKEILDKVYNIACAEDNIKKEEFQSYCEHITFYMYKHQDEFKIGYVKGEGNYIYNKEINYSVDRQEDFEIVQKLLS